MCETSRFIQQIKKIFKYPEAFYNNLKFFSAGGASEPIDLWSETSRFLQQIKIFK